MSWNWHFLNAVEIADDKRKVSFLEKKRRSFGMMFTSLEKRLLKAAHDVLLEINSSKRMVCVNDYYITKMIEKYRSKPS